KGCRVLAFGTAPPIVAGAASLAPAKALKKRQPEILSIFPYPYHIIGKNRVAIQEIFMQSCNYDP
ncbi:MAG: hypothetical protein AAF975_06665, partial [Spirochaetota bacterium]